MSNDFRNHQRETMRLRYKYKVIGAGYGCAFIVTFITILVDRNYSESQQCSDIRPRFEEMCFFAGSMIKIF